MFMVSGMLPEPLRRMRIKHVEITLGLPSTLKQYSSPTEQTFVARSTKACSDCTLRVHIVRGEGSDCQVMYKAPGHALESVKGPTKASLAAEKDEIAKRFAGALIIRTDGPIRAPVVTLQGEKANLYNVIEKHLRPEVVVGAERFWKLIRSMYNPNLDTWRPRVNGVQLKALQGARLPETDQEWHCVKVILETIVDWIREDSSPEAFLQELKELVSYCESWWDNRTKREGIHSSCSKCPMCAAKA